jgi:hypothetical protein
MKVSVDRRMKGFPIESSGLDSCVRWFKQTSVPEADPISIARGLIWLKSYPSKIINPHKAAAEHSMINIGQGVMNNARTIFFLL